MKKLLGLIFPVILILIGIQFTRDYFGNTSKERKNELEQLISQGKETLGILNDQYKQKTTKIGGARIITYEIGYTFTANDQKFSGSKTVKEKPTVPMVKVKYLPSNPQINAINPQEELNSLQESQGKTKTLLIGLGLILVGFLLGIFRLRSKQKTA